MEYDCFTGLWTCFTEFTGLWTCFTEFAPDYDWIDLSIDLNIDLSIDLIVPYPGYTDPRRYSRMSSYIKKT